MTIIQLEYLLAVANCGSFSQAAEHCFVTQPSLSMQIKSLEEELGVVLLDRSKKPVIPTEAGAAVLEQARETLKAYNCIREAVAELKGETSGKFIASGYYIHNNIVANRTLFFDTETVLDGYGGFTAPAGSMLNTYENIDDTFRARAELGVDFPINPIGCMFKTGLRYNFNYNPYFQGTEELIAREHGAALNLGIDSNFSEYFEFGINSRTGFSYTRRSNGTMERLWAESLQARADAIMLKESVRIGAFYDMSIYRYPEFESGNRTTHMLNMTLNFSFHYFGHSNINPPNKREYGTSPYSQVV